MNVRQQTLWEEPTAGTVVKDGAGRKVVGPDGKTSTKRGRSYCWLLCDVCFCGSWVGGLAPDQSRLGDEEYRKNHGRPCRMTPHCTGRHVLDHDPGHAVPDAVWTGLLALFTIALLAWLGFLGWR